jgi:methyl-accepting chemotaxis protein
MAQALPQIANANLTAPNQNDNPQPGSPTQPAVARSLIANTSIALSNSNLAHVCDITGDMRYGIAWVSLQVKQLVETIRNAIQGLWASASSSPFGDEIRAVIKAIQAKVKQIQKLISKIQEVQKTLNSYIAQLQELIAFIASLPARIAAFLQNCLSAATASLKDAIGNASSIVSSSQNSNLATAAADLKNANIVTAASSTIAPIGKP